MQIEQLEKIIESAKKALSARKGLAQLHQKHAARSSEMGFSRSRTTTYNAAASDKVETAQFHEAELAKLITSK